MRLYYIFSSNHDELENGLRNTMFSIHNQDEGPCTQTHIHQWLSKICEPFITLDRSFGFVLFLVLLEICVLLSLKHITRDENYSTRWQAKWKFMRAVIITCIIPVLFSQSQTWNKSRKKLENHPLFRSITNIDHVIFPKKKPKTQSTIPTKIKKKMVLIPF